MALGAGLNFEKSVCNASVQTTTSTGSSVGSFHMLAKIGKD